jgi:hypothetical protein
MRLKELFGIGEDLVKSFTNPYVTLNREAIDAVGADPEDVATAVAAELQNLPGIAFAITSSALEQGAFNRNRVSEAVMYNFNADRSGDIYVVFQPHWFVADFDGLSVASAHGSPWTYDSFVPVIFAGPGIEPARVTRRVHTVDVAPTIAAYLGAKPPSGATGLPLPEALP